MAAGCNETDKTGAIPYPSTRERPVGEGVDHWKGVEVRGNGADALRSHGRHYEWGDPGGQGQADPVLDGSLGYYFGQKWQCVEFIKRFYFQALNHSMPDPLGHAVDFFDWETGHGQSNPKRALVQFCNGSSVPPQEDDLVVFARPRGYGHVAIVTRVLGHGVEIIQQNTERPRVVLRLESRHGRYWLMSRAVCLGWLRKDSPKLAGTADVPHG